jgi:hypothetical protein
MAFQRKSTVLGSIVGMLIGHAAMAAPTGIALVIGNASYSALPPLPGCAKGPLQVSAALTALGYDVIERANASAGQLDGAIGAINEKLRSTPEKPLLIYFCGYFASVNDRPFVLPSTAAPQGPADLLTQGMLAKAFIDVVARSGARPAILLLDAVPTPGFGAPLGLETLNRRDVPLALNLLGVTVGLGDASGDAPTALATALVPALKGSSIAIADLIDNASAAFDATAKGRITLRRNATEPGYIVGAPPPPAPVPAAAVAPEPPKEVAAAPPTAQPPPEPPAPVPVDLPDAARMTETDRRVAQTALARLGYYAGPIDGVFGSETLAAIRRLQHELKAPMTGQLTAAQARWLVTHQ